MWAEELGHYCPDTPIILVGTQIDLREDEQTLRELAKQGQQPVTQAEGKLTAKAIGACKYMEMSAVTRQGLKEAFDEALLTVVMKPLPMKRQRAACTIL